MSARSSEPEPNPRTQCGREPRGRWTGAAALAALFLACLLTGCPRDPEPPTGGGGDLVNLSDPDSVLLQIQLGVVSGLITQYMNAFTQDFVFNPDQVDSITLSGQLPGVFDNWTFEVEQQVMQLVLGTSTQRSVTFANAESTVVSDREVLLRENYVLFLDQERYRGQAEFFMIREASNDWRIFRWRDRQDPADPDTTWGILKGLNRGVARGAVFGGGPTAPDPQGTPGPKRR